MAVRITILLVLALAITTTEAVDKNKFRTCAQTSFCNRNRFHSNPTYVKQDYQLVNPLTDDSSASLTFELHNARYPLQPSLSGHIQMYTHGIPRITIKEKSPIHGRHIVKDVLTFEEGVASSPRTLHIHTNTKWSQSEHTDTNGQRSYVITADSYNSDGTHIHLHITHSPFVLTYSVNGEKVAVVNGRGLLHVEQQRQKNPKPPPYVPQAVHADPVDTETNADGGAATPAPPPPQPVEFDPAIHPFDFDMDGMWEESHGSHTDHKQRGPEAISMDISFIGSQHVYGIPEHASDFALKSTVGASSGDYHEPYRLYNLDVFEYELDVPMALYGAVPFMVSHTAKHTAGFFWLNSAETYIDIADANIGGGLFSSGEHRKDIQWISESGIIDAWLLPGPTPQAVNYQYGLLTGFPAMPQYFAIAHHQCRWNYKSQDDVRDVDAGFDTWDIPYDVIWLDIEHTDGKKYFTWDKSLFPQPIAMQDAIASKGRKMVTIVDPHIKRDAGYHIHTEAQQKGLYVKNKDGGDYEGWCWPGSVSYLDFFNPEIRSFWASKYALDSYEGSTKHLFIWNDMNEPSVFNGPEVSMPKDCLHNSGTTPHRDVHNQYGFYTQMATQQGLIERDAARPFVLTRAFFAGSQRYGAVWTGDNAAEWGHLEVANPMILSLNIAGITFAGADVGGFFKDPPVSLLVRWYQAAAYQPFFRAHAHIDTKRREPWLFGEPHTSHIRDAIRTRYALLPYVYTTFATAHWTGQPIVRPLWYHFPTDATTFAHQASFLLGHDLLIHPVTHDEQWTTSVYLPGTNHQTWYDVITDTPYVGGTTHTIDTPIHKIPVFQRGGSIITRRDRVRRASSLMAHDPMTLYIALDSHHHANGTIYMDDGSSFQYQSGHYLYRVLTYNKHIITSKSITETTYPTDVRIERIVIIGLNDKVSYTQAQVTDSQGAYTVSVSRHGSRVIIRKPDVNIGRDFTIELQH